MGSIVVSGTPGRVLSSPWQQGVGDVPGGGGQEPRRAGPSALSGVAKSGALLLPWGRGALESWAPLRLEERNDRPPAAAAVTQGGHKGLRSMKLECGTCTVFAVPSIQAMVVK